VAQIFPRALGSLSVASYDSQGYGGGIRPASTWECLGQNRNVCHGYLRNSKPKLALLARTSRILTDRINDKYGCSVQRTAWNQNTCTSDESGCNNPLSAFCSHVPGLGSQSSCVKHSVAASVCPKLPVPRELETPAAVTPASHALFLALSRCFTTPSLHRVAKATY
jgi:hypothetical protein